MKVLLTGGGTLGSVTPLIALTEQLRDKNTTTEFLWLGTKTGPEAELVLDANIEFRAISAGRWRRFLTWQNLATPFLVIKGLIDAFKIIKNWRPDVVISAGGFVAVPVVWSAWLLRVPVHIHQMDWRPGLANKLSAPFASSVSVTFEKSIEDFLGKEVYVTGNPVRQIVLCGNPALAREKYNLKDDRPVVLVLGGGTGALNLNKKIVEALPSLANVQIVHITGVGKSTVVSTSENYQQIDFSGADFGHLMSATDLVITRAGMGTLTELSAVGKPAIIVPIPNSHQVDNAEVFVKLGGAVMYNEQEPADQLAKLIMNILTNSEQLKTMSAKMMSINNPEAGKVLASIICDKVKS